VTNVVLTYTGVPEKRQLAEAKLRSSMPGLVLTPKTSTLIEAQLDDSQISLLVQDPNWAVSEPVCAEIRRPAMNLKNARAKLSRDR
jgi:hypothetical protein